MSQGVHVTKVPLCIMLSISLIQTLDEADGEKIFDRYNQSNAADYHCTLG